MSRYLSCLVLLSFLSLHLPGAISDSTFGQLLLTYYSGVGYETLGSGGVNALAMAFFDPIPLATTSNCNFNDLGTPCIRPEVGAGTSLNLSWAVNLINQTATALSGNTSPKRGSKPTVLFSFGGANAGGSPWDSIFSNQQQATQFGTNCASLVKTVAAMSFPTPVFIGIDLDIEDTTTTLPQFASFAKSFRAGAAYNSYPLQLCALSGLASTGSSDHYKVTLMQNYGPGSSTPTINFLNMMVNNQDASCSDMAVFWQNSALNFIPAGNKVCGIWGENNAAWIIHDPGCTSGSNPLFPWMKSNGVGVGIWEWWSGSTTDITKVLSQIRTG